jgi:hypothetical protein
MYSISKSSTTPRMSRACPIKTSRGRKVFELEGLGRRSNYLGMTMCTLLSSILLRERYDCGARLRNSDGERCQFIQIHRYHNNMTAHAFWSDIGNGLNNIRRLGAYYHRLNQNQKTH